MEARGEQKIMQHMFLQLHQPSLCQNIQPSPETTMTPQNSPGSNISDFAICSALVITYHDWFQQGTRVCSIGLYAMHKITQSCMKDLSHFIFLQVSRSNPKFEQVEWRSLSRAAPPASPRSCNNETHSRMDNLPLLRLAETVVK
ncbi:hypothetical protein SAY87_010706 [Trapa incisa]|uniref:Uncharacterized protein n=1 Tax=Trapa incisa TaxID=236973 RepID=A0AAN7GLV8_9MYRT|nr:hypothetical protein SAY87_010706 [Trapa incisa]